MAARVVAVAHFPPPVHGMAVAVERLVTRLEAVTSVRRVSISAPGLDRSPRYHAVRVARVIAALGVLTVERRRSGRVFLSCDAGGGMVYTLALVCWARALGYRAFLQHHSYAYVARRSRVLAALIRVGGDRCEHLVTCPIMAGDLRAAYPAVATRVVGVATGLRTGTTRRPSGSGLVLGFLGNVTVAKGIDLAVATAQAAYANGLEVELRVAGPIVDPEAERILGSAVASGTPPPAHVGPVYQGDRDDFLDGLDVFLFPSRYSHESFGLVAWEAMSRGVPVLAHRAGCLTAEAVGEAGVVVDRDADFVAAAVEALGRWCREPEALASASRAASSAAHLVSARAELETSRFCREIAGASATCPSGGS